MDRERERERESEMDRNLYHRAKLTAVHVVPVLLLLHNGAPTAAMLC